MIRSMWVWALASLICTAATAGKLWADEGQEQYQPGSPQPQTAAPTSGASGGIIGYQPIPASVLEGVLTGTPQTQRVVPTSYQPVTGQPAPAQLGYPVTGQIPPTPGAPSQLPMVYLTGVVGEGLYTLGRDDVIQIDVRGQTEFTGPFVIGFDGRIQYNYLGDIPVAGMTKYEVQQVLEKLLQKYIRTPAVTVTILAYNSKVVYVIGEVGRPGKYIMRGDIIKLREAILAAGLPTPTAAIGRVHVISPDLKNPRVRKINLKKILYKGKLQDDIDLYPSEIVVVPSTVLSSVNRFLSQLLNPITRATSAAALAAL